ncbi:methylmalonic aciduria and homocystinuria type D homolog, mitochondrial-like, partial [Notothenia coriiceps]|uniref:Methylmalonic aciduria and homocystinuria type D homolog, mitochondrial-like n=1 Tax=Notothenia coriiceps TaxID=8208 RepID=A0A6I9NAM7_9TELE
MLPVEGFQHTEVWAVVQEGKILTHDDTMFKVRNRRPHTMSSSVLCGRGRLVLSKTAGHQVLAALRVGRTRTFSAASSDEPYISSSHTDSGPRTVWPDESMGPFGPQDQRFQLPGNSGFDCHLEGMGHQKKLKTPVHRTVPDVLTAPSCTERHQFILAQFVNEFQGNLGGIDSRVNKAEQYFHQTDTDCAISSCPELLRKDLELMFPSAPTASITVVTVTQSNSRCEEEEEQDREQQLNKVSAVTYSAKSSSSCLFYINMCPL